MKKFYILLIMMLTFSGFAFSQVSSRMDNPPAPVMASPESHVTRASGCNFLVFMDNLPWNSSAIQTILTANGESWVLQNSASMASTDFSMYDVIIIASDQIPSFYDNFAANFAKFVTFVTNGGSLEVHAATCGWNSPCGYSVLLPGGVFTTEQYDDYNLVVDAAHPIVAGVSSPFSGSYASHGYFSNLVAGTDIITETSSNNKPTTIQYVYGAGIVTATTCTYEFGYDFGQEAGEMLVNNLNYGCEHAIDAKVPVSDWAIAIGIFMILFAAVLRYRRVF
ncbi:MAG TPA: hypothetical protein PLW31_02450 [Bacteroidales bacterium]|nr:hypothetical protein [Bacteroidales bacterium]